MPDPPALARVRKAAADSHVDLLLVWHAAELKRKHERDDGPALAQAVRLAYSNGHSYVEIAGVLGVTRQSVRELAGRG